MPDWKVGTRVDGLAGNAGARPVEVEEPGVFVAVIQGGGRINFITAAPNEVELFERLGAYTAQWCELQLYPSDTARVRYLLRIGETPEAVRHYFGCPARRWERERLVIRHVECTH